MDWRSFAFSRGAEVNAIELKGVSKRFGGVQALADVTFSIREGEVHAVVGENGAGKSTLMKLLAGLYPPDSGGIALHGSPVRLNNPLEARARGISIVYQELNLFPHLSVSANIFLNRELVSAGLLRRRAMRSGAIDAMREIGVALDPDAKVAGLSMGEKQLVEIARTIAERSQIVILDEPNSALTESESSRLFEIIRTMRDQGITVIYVSHRLEEVFAISDRITVLRDGRYEGTWDVSESTVARIIAAMIGKSPGEIFPEQPDATSGPPILSVRDLVKAGKLGPLSFEARAGEIVGFSGLEGAGVETLFRILFGLERADGGRIRYGDRDVPPRSSARAIREGWGLIPASRRDEGLMMDWSIRRNATLLVLDRLMRKIGVLDHRRSRGLAEDYARRLRISTDSVDKAVLNLSGGNQQKVLLAKWLATGPRILILNDPTRGVDVGAKAEIYALIGELADQGLAILLTSSEVEEIIGLSNRTLVFHKGRILREFGACPTKPAIMHALSGALE